MADMSENRVKEVRGMFEGPLLPLVLKLSLPVFGGMVVQLVYNITDTWFISRINPADPSLIGGIGLVFPVIFFAVALANGLMVGTSSLVARAIGERNHEVLDRVAESGMAIGAFFLAMMLVVTYGFGAPIIKALGGAGDYARHALEYLRWITPCAVTIFMGSVLFGILQGEGKMLVLMAGNLTGTILNIFLDWLFIHVFKQGIPGAALATVISQFIGLSIILIAFLAGKSSVRIHWKIANIRWVMIRQILLIGAPMGLAQVTMALSFIVFNRIVAGIDPYGLTALALCGRFDQAVTIPSMAIGSAMITIVGQNGGRGLFARARRAWFTGVSVGLAVVGITAAVIVVFAPRIYSLFTDVPQVLDYCVRQTRILEFTFMFAVIGIVGRSVFQAFGFPVPAVLLVLLRLVIIAIPTAWIFAHVLGLGMTGVWIGIAAGNAASALAGFITCMITFKKLETGSLILKKTLA
jgi:putative MATE family efflux protein